MIRQLTATVYIIENEQILLIHHKKFKKWHPPGGHLEPNELPSEAAIREAKEETGLDVELIPQENIWINQRWNVKSFERPYLCLLGHAPAHNDFPAHEHIDFVYLGRSSGGELKHNADETNDMRWFSLSEVEELERDIEIFDETYQIIAHFMKLDKSLPSYLTCEPV